LTEISIFQLEIQDIALIDKEELLMQLSDKQIACVRGHIRSTFHNLENEEFIRNSSELMLRCVEMTTFFVLADIVESLPASIHEDVKRLLHAREQLWKEVME
jgi:hypothetical protein